MSSVALPTAVPHVRGRSTLWQLARLESRRYARHPLFLVGLGLGLLASAGEHGPIELDYQVIPAFFLGVLGIVVAARLTTSTEKSAPVVDSTPVSQTLRTAALCMACWVPAAAGLLMVSMHRAFVLADPFPDWMYGTYGAGDRLLITMVIPAVACAGGPLLGVCIGRWLRFPGAALLTVIVVLFWCNLAAYVPVQSMDSGSLLARVLHMAAPYTAFGSSNGDGENPATIVTSHTGSPLWFAAWTVCLCALAATAALWRGADRHTRPTLTKVGTAASVVAVVAITLAVAGGNHRLYDSSSEGTVAVDSPASQP